MPTAPPLPSVLLVEDDPTNQLVALSMLRHLGVEADAASNGRVGVRMATERAYDVVLMDIQMPVMDGVEAMKAIRARLGPGAAPRIVAVTAYAVAGTRERLLEAGFDAFFTKPLSIERVREALAPPAPSPAFVARPAADAGDGAREALLEAVRAHVRDLLGEDDEAFVADLVSSFASSSQEAAREAADARAQGDAAAVGAAAHKLKGSASNVGLDGLTAAWDAVEASARRGDAAALADPLDAALSETERALALLEA